MAKYHPMVSVAESATLLMTLPTPRGAQAAKKSTLDIIRTGTAALVSSAN